jgi:hypothetical protein
METSPEAQEDPINMRYYSFFKENGTSENATLVFNG